MSSLTTALVDLFAALEQFGHATTRAADGDARTGAAEVSGHVAHLASLFDGPTLTPSSDPAPRDVAVAMAMALFSEPHSRRTLAIASTASESVVVRADDALAVTLGLSARELETLRNEVDRRVAEVLTRIRAMQWLWSRAGNPRTDPTPLHRLLFPGEQALVPTRYLRHGCRLYAVVAMDRPPPAEGLYLPWLPDARQWSARPDGQFDARQLDDSLVRTLGRAIGRDLESTRAILDDVVCVVPEPEAKLFLARDRWRAEGWADVTGLGRPSRGLRATAPVPTDALDVASWMLATDEGGVAIQGARRVFDRLARERVDVLMDGLYAELAARQLADHGVTPSGQPAVFDLAPYLDRALRPLVEWTARPEVRAHVAEVLGLPEPTVTVALQRVGQAWDGWIERTWTTLPDDQHPVTVPGILVAHLARVQASLARLRRQGADPRADHRRMLLLCFAHHAARAPVGRLWRPVDGRVPEPEDLMGRWFWPTWQQVLDTAIVPEEPVTSEVDLHPDGA